MMIPLTHTLMSGLDYMDATADPGAERLPLRILSLNTWARSRNVDQIEALLRQEDADLVVLSEFPSSKHRLLENLKSVYPHRLWCGAGCRMALLSKQKWLETGIRKRGAGRAPMVWAHLKIGATPLMLIGAHLTRPRISQPTRPLEIRELAEQINRFDGHVVLVGDLNMTPWSDDFKTLIKLTHLRGPKGIRPTWPVAGMLPAQLAIDHVLVSKGIRIERAFLADRVGSDHLPLVADLSIGYSMQSGMLHRSWATENSRWGSDRYSKVPLCVGRDSPPLAQYYSPRTANGMDRLLP